MMVVRKSTVTPSIRTHYAEDEGYPNACGRPGPVAYYILEVDCPACRRTEVFMGAVRAALTVTLSAQGWVPK